METETRVTSDHYSISRERLAAVVAALATARPNQPSRLGPISDFLLADWPEGAEHQTWLDTAPAAEIADWYLAGQSCYYS